MRATVLFEGPGKFSIEDASIRKPRLTRSRFALAQPGSAIAIFTI